MRLPAFSLIEVLLVIASIATLAGVSIPLYQSYRIRSDLYLAEDIVTQALYRARLLSQIGEQDAVWSYHIGSGVVFKGDDFVQRDSAFDEDFSLPESVSVTGIDLVQFTRVYGVPSPSGDIVLESLNGEKVYVDITADTAIAGDKPPPVQFKVHFERLENSGPSSAENIVRVGTEGVVYTEGEWIPLTEQGEGIVDDTYVLEDEGFTVQRGDGFVRVTNFGGLESGGKNIIDAYIIFDKAVIQDVRNEEGILETENPFNGNVSNGVGGDEVTLSAEKKSVFFQTRTTTNGDTILLYWTPSG